MKNYQEVRSDKDRDDLFEHIKKKIQTTMIGSLSSIEEHFAFLWQDDPEMMNKYQKLRSEILDKGNKQIRYIDLDLCNYEVRKRIKKTIPINKD